MSFGLCNDQVVRVRNLAVFDRRGNALYLRTDLPINDPSEGWNGHFREELMDPGGTSMSWKWNC